MEKNISRVNKVCKYFPCHIKLEDCTFCYCPYYPCGDDNRGNFIYTKDKHKVWSCQNCNWIHQKSVVDEIFKLIRNKYNPHPIKPETGFKKTGIIIIGHGSKLARANKLLLKIVNAARHSLGVKNILPAYMQFHGPNLSVSIKKLVARGCQRIIIVPFFLFKGNHVSIDIPSAIEAEKKRFRQIKFVFAKNLGDDERLEEVVIERIKEATRCAQRK